MILYKYRIFSALLYPLYSQYCTLSPKLSLIYPTALPSRVKLFSFKTKNKKSIPLLRQKMINLIPCLRQKSRQTYPGWLHVSIKPLYGSTLPGLDTLQYSSCLALVSLLRQSKYSFNLRSLQGSLFASVG